MSLLTAGLTLIVGVLGGALAAVLWAHRAYGPKSFEASNETSLDEETDPVTPPGYPGAIPPVDVAGESIDSILFDLDTPPKGINGHDVEGSVQSLDDFVDEHL